MVSRVHLVIFQFIVKSLFSVSVDVAITLIVNHVKFLGVFFLCCLFESLLLSVIVFRSLFPLSHKKLKDSLKVKYPK